MCFDTLLLNLDSYNLPLSSGAPFPSNDHIYFPMTYTWCSKPHNGVHHQCSNLEGKCMLKRSCMVGQANFLEP